MTYIEAFILPPRTPLAATSWIAGLAPAERAALALHRGGVDRIVLMQGRAGVDRTMLERLARRGLDVAVARDLHGDWRTTGAALILVSEDVVFEPAAVPALVERLQSARLSGVAAAEAIYPGAFAAFTPEGATALLDSPVDPFEAIDHLRTVRLGDVFCTVVSSRRQVASIERAYITRGNGVESITTRAARAFSVPISRVLLGLGVSANQVTLFGFSLAVLAALFFSRRAFWPGVAGAILYYASMVLDCSDGEVARASFSDSRFGAWLETVTDYLSYFVVMGGLVWGELRYEGFCLHVESAMIAGAASLAIVGIVGYMRGRVASENPGAFDDALSAELGNGSATERFAVWGRQLIKRSFFAHLVLFMAAIGHLPALLEVWAYGGAAALIVVLAVRSGVMQRVRIAPVRVPVAIGAREE